MFRTLFLLLFIFFQVNFAHADEKWIAVVVMDGRNKGVTEYYGSVSDDVFDRITKKVEDKAMFMLSSAFWIDDDGKVIEMKEAQNHGHKYGYLNTIYFREDTILRIVLLDKAYLDSIKTPQPNKS